MATGRSAEREDSASSRTASAGGSAERLLEQVPPYDERAEVGVLGSMLMDPHAAAVAIEDLKPEDFYLPRHRIIFTVFSQLFHKFKSDIDEVTLCGELERQGRLDEAGGRETIGRLIMETPSPASIESYCSLVRGRAIERELIEAGGKILRMARAPSAEDSDELVAAAEKIVYDIADKRTSDDAVPMTTLMQKAIEEAEVVQAAHREGREVPTPALPTRYPDLDRLLSGGLWPGELVVIAGRPSMGKTTFALNIARHISVGNENEVKPTAIFSLEMPREQVAKNILCAIAELHGQKMRRYDFNEAEFATLQGAVEALRLSPMYIDDTSGLSLSQLRARCRRLRHFHGIELIIIDYLQLMRGSPNMKSREQEVADISRGLKALSRDLRIPVIVLSQLNRSAERRENEDKRPQLSDLRESGAIEQDADVVIMLYRPEYYDLDGNAKTQNTGEALVMKNRNGPVGKVQLTFRKDILRFESYAQQPDVAAGS
jgi:replicative DNA helicase